MTQIWVTLGRQGAEAAGTGEAVEAGAMATGVAMTVVDRSRAAGGVESTGSSGRMTARPGRRGRARRANVQSR